jgi:hypothetical protein
MPKQYEELKVGDRVRAKIRVYECPGKDSGPPNPDSVVRYGGEYIRADYVHAEPGELGTVVGLDDDRVQVRFDRTETASDVTAIEVEHVP